MHPVVEEIIGRAQKSLPIRRIWLFGTRARRAHRTTSDIDLAFDLSAPVPDKWAPFVADIEEEAQMLLAVDLVDIVRCDVALRKTILREGILLYGG